MVQSHLFFPTATKEGNGNPLQYSCLENPVDRGAQQATVYGAAESDTTGRFTTREVRFDIPYLGTVGVYKPVVAWNAPQFTWYFLVNLCELPIFARRAAQK